MGTGKYSSLFPRAKELYEQGLSSNQVATEIIKENQSLVLRFDSLSRMVRREAQKRNWRKSSKRVSTAKVLVFDIETAPIQCYTWGIWKQNVNTDMIIKDWYVLCWSAKWLFKDEVISMKCTPEEVEVGNDERIVRGIWDLLNEADIIIAHNLEKFDKKRVQTRFFKYELGLPSPYNSIDTLQHLRKKFQIVSNRLDYVAKDFLGIAGKMDTPKGLWRKCIEGDKESMDVMSEYCDQDVRVLEDVYLKLRPYIQPHPNIGLIEGVEGLSCPCCGSNNLNIDGEYHTYVNVFDSYRCGDCGSISRSRKNVTPKSTKDSITVSIPR